MYIDCCLTSLRVRYYNEHLTYRYTRYIIHKYVSTVLSLIILQVYFLAYVQIVDLLMVAGSSIIIPVLF